MADALMNTIENDQNLETFCLIWLDASVNNSQENVQAQQKLRTSINHLVTLENDHQCLRYIQSVPKDDKIILIVSGRLGRIIVPQVHQFRQIISIYVYCMDKKANEQWANQFTKVKGVIVRLDELIKQIQVDQTQRQHSKIDESLSISVFNSTSDGQSTSGLNGDFIHSQLLIDCLIRMKSSSTDKNELIALCKQEYKDNDTELKILKEFERDYVPERALWWYSRQSFLYRLLNKALRVQNIDLLFLFRFFIRDIGQELEKNKCSSSIQVYRSQVMSKEEIQTLKESINTYISINSFFSTSVDRQQARAFLSNTNCVDDSEQVFFEIDADPRIDNVKPFSNITSLSYYSNEKEVLFMVGSIFRLVNICCDQDGIWIIRLVLCSNNDHQLKSLFTYMRKTDDDGETDLIALGGVLEAMGKLNDAEKYYHRLLVELPDNDNQTAYCYQGLGNVAEKKGNYESSLKWHNKSLETEMKRFGSDHVNIAYNYNNIANAFHRKGNYIRAIESYQKALEILQRICGKDHLDVAQCHNNMGAVYEKEKKYSEAMNCHQIALAIRQKHLPADHSSLGESHNNLANIHVCLTHYDLALKHYNESLKIKSKCLPSQHPNIAMTLNNIGIVYDIKNELQQALSYYEKAAAIYRQTVPATHPSAVRNEKNIRDVLSRLKQ